MSHTTQVTEPVGGDPTDALFAPVPSVDPAALLSMRQESGTKAVASITAPAFVLTLLPLGWGQQQHSKSPTEEHHRMPCWHFHAAAAGLQLVAWLGRSNCVSLQLYRCTAAATPPLRLRLQ